jgi:hypothetical protein
MELSWRPGFWSLMAYIVLTKWCEHDIELVARLPVTVLFELRRGVPVVGERM